MPRRKLVAHDQCCYFQLVVLCSVTTLKRLLDGVAVLVLILVTLTLIYRPAAMFQRTKIQQRLEPLQDILPLSRDFIDDGFRFTSIQEKEKFLSYDPPIGSWSMQLQAFENAIIISKLLNRTLLARALASEPEIKRLQRLTRSTMQPDSKVHDILDRNFTVPVSAVIDFSLLSKLIKVRDFRGSNQDFLSDHKNWSWYDVCHKDSTGFWVDFIPSSDNQEAWKILEAQEFVPFSIAILQTEPFCDHQLDIPATSHPTPSIRGIITELSKIKEDIVYFRGGSIATNDIRFLSKERTELAQKWTLNYIRFTPYVQERTQQIIAKINKPYNAVLISKEDEETNISSTINFRLKQMEKMKFKDITNRLYIITRMKNGTLFDPFRRRGYDISFSDSLIPSGINHFVQHDVRELLGFIICKYARLYVGSTDSYLIRRGRVHEATRRDGLLTNHVTIRWAVHTIKRTYRLKPGHNDTGQSLRTQKAHYITCNVCKFMQSTEKHALCAALLSECAKLRLN